MGCSFALVMICSETFTLWLIVLCALFSVSPLLLLLGGRSFPVVDNDLDAAIKVVDSDSPLTLSSLYIVLIPASDLILDYLSLLYRGGIFLKKSIANGAVVRLSDVERLLFILGITAQSAKYLIQNSEDLYTIALVNNCIDNTSAFLLLAPIIVFLGRCTITFTRTRTFCLIMLMVLGLFFRTIGHFIVSDALVQVASSIAGTLFFFIACIVYGILIASCISQYCDEKLRTSNDRRQCLRWFTHYQTDINSNNNEKDQNTDMNADNDSDLYINYIPGLHIASSIVIIAGASARHMQAELGYLVLLAEITVLVLELRIRKNEVARGLVSILVSIVFSVFFSVFLFRFVF